MKVSHTTDSVDPALRQQIQSHTSKQGALLVPFQFRPYIHILILQDLDMFL